VKELLLYFGYFDAKPSVSFGYSIKNHWFGNQKPMVSQLKT